MYIRVMYLLVIFLSFVSSAVQAKDYSKLFEKVSPGVAVVFAVSEQDRIDAPEGYVSHESIGTAFLIDDSGLLMTAAHVVDRADKIEVYFRVNDEPIHARVVALDVQADVALLKVESTPKSAVVLNMGDSSKSRIGEEVFVIGSPYGIEHTLTVGHLSGRQPMEGFMQDYEDAVFLQTDAAINQGNSGGPIFNGRGEVIGIVSHIASSSGGSEGLGFAASINIARTLLIDEQRMWAGMIVMPVFDEMASALNVPGGYGMLVQKVINKSPAYYMGLKSGNIPVEIAGQQLMLGGDIILSVMGIPLKKHKDVLGEIRQAVDQVEQGGRIELEVLRAGKREILYTTKQASEI